MVEGMAGNHLIGREIVLKPFDKTWRNIGDVVGRAPDVIVIKHGDDFVIGHAAVDGTQPAHDDGIHQDLRMVNRPLAEHADIQWVAVGLGQPPA